MSPVDRVAHLNRWRSRPLVEKALLTFGMMVLAITLPPFPTATVVAAVMVLASLAGARIPFRIWFGCAVAPIGFLVVGAISLLVQIDSSGISWAPGGMIAAAGLVMRSLAGLFCLLFLALTTPATDLVAGARRLGLPAEVAEMALLTYRFVFLVGETALSMDAAQAARLGHSGWRRRLHSLGVLIGNLLPRALDRARRLEIGLAARGWKGDMRVLTPHHPPSFLGLSLVVVLLIATAAVGVFGR